MSKITRNTRKPLRQRILNATCLSAVALAASAMVAEDVMAQGATGALMDEILVVGTKKSAAENLQDVPVAVTAYGDEQLDALKVRDLQSLSFSMPNVALDDIGTTRGTANFSIRGLGVNSSIPSIDPTVGVFVDGMYLGINAGVVFDVFDLEGVEVLRGPQGLLFGRNVTGGAVLLKTKKPGDEFEADAKIAAESGFRGTGINYYAMGSLSGPVVEDKLQIKLAGYYNNDGGWHENLFTGESHGEAETWLLRPVVRFTPNEDWEFLVRYEHGDAEGDGPAAQNHGLFSSDDSDFSINETGFYDNEWDQVVFETNWDIGPGTLTNIFGWRDYEATNLSDIDASIATVFHAGTNIQHEQFSNELRYSGRFFDRADITVGGYYFTQDIAYQENRILPQRGLDFSGGGLIDHETWAIFASTDIDLNDTLTLTLGGRYSYEEKDAQIATLFSNLTPTIGMIVFPAPPGGCDVNAGCVFDFPTAGDPTEQGSDDWSSFTPKVGLQWQATEDLQIYGFWTKGFRSGGYNLRNTDPLFDPGPFDQEETNAFEIGAKSEFADGRGRLNAAIFYNEVEDLQRELNVPGIAGVTQIIQNTADAEFLGVEVEGQFAVTDNFLLQGSVGYVDNEYQEVRFDLNGDGLIDSLDEALDVPRAAEWTYSAGFTYDHDMGDMGILTLRGQYNHRDESFFTDNNLGRIEEADIVDASLSWRSEGGAWGVSLYGKNLTDDIINGGDTILPGDPPVGPFPGAATFSPATLANMTGDLQSFAPINKGRIIGLEATFKY